MKSLLISLVLVLLSAHFSYASGDDGIVDLKSIDLNNAIVIGNPNASTKLVVFSEPDCSYCRKYHKELKRLTSENSNVCVLLLLYPLKTNPEAYDKSLAIIGSRSTEVLDAAFNGEDIGKGPESSRPILDNFMAQASKLNIIGVPMTIMPNGRVVAGTQDYDIIKAILAQNSQPIAAALQTAPVKNPPSSAPANSTPPAITITSPDVQRSLKLVSKLSSIIVKPDSSATIVEPIPSGAYYALIIGVKEYSDPNIPSLDHPLQDAQRVYDLLTSAYTFDQKNVTFLKNPDQGQILDELDNLADRVAEDDSLLVFYAGHGYWDEKLKQGYWLPSDASKGSRARWLSNSTIRDYINGIKSKHTLLVADACFSGGIFKTRSIGDTAPRAVQELYRLPSRKAMTSGMMKEVPDRSVFVEYLLKRLKDNAEQYMSSEQLFSSLRQAVINNSPNAQVPQFGEIRETGDEGGDFVFVRRYLADNR